MLLNFSRLAFIDVETTGGKYTNSRITEIGGVLYENGVQVREFHTLINPQCVINDFIVNMTGITNEAVAAAPVFPTVSSELLEFLSGALFVAHDANTDYNFIKQELSRSGREYYSPRLCTVKLSRNIYPDQTKHSLDTIINRHSIICNNRHRALDDAKVLPEFYNKVRSRLNNEEFNDVIKRLIEV